jgi:DNA-binding transcriptional ArsR family regulator
MEITDPKAIRALAHPLRLDLLELLSARGPATAAHCGRVLGESQASFHLRQLAKHGFVEDAGPGRDRRERTWRVPEPRLRLSISAGHGAAVQRELERLVVERELRAVLDWVDHKDAESAEWRGQATIVSAIAILSVEEAAELKARMKDLIEPYLARAEAGAGPADDSGDAAAERLLQPGQRAVRFFMAATPLPLLESGGTEE